MSESFAEGMVYGINPVLALLADKNRSVESVSFQKGGRGNRFQEAVDLCRERKLRPHFVDRETLDRMTGRGVHQGLVARVGFRKQPTFDDILNKLQHSPDAILLLLDGVEDPHNLGAVLRSAEAFGVLAVILPKDRSAPLSPAAIKASAGAGERVDLIRVTNLARSMETLKSYGVQIYGLAGEQGQPLKSVSFEGPIALVLGGEFKGLRRLTRDKCDQLISIPITGLVGSLNLSVAAGIGLYEVMRGREN